jgi:hypothetical protein
MTKTIPANNQGEPAKEPSQDEAVWGITEADYPPFPPFSIGGQATAYEWMMVWDDREPYAPWFGISGEDPEQAEARWRMMLDFAEEASRNLVADIQDGTIPLVKRAYRRNRLGDTELDKTRCVISREVMLDDFAKRVGGYKTKIAELLASRGELQIPRDDPGRDKTTSLTGAAATRVVTKQRRGRRPGSGEIDDSQSVREMLHLLARAEVASRWAAAGEVSRLSPGYDQRATQRRLYKKFRTQYGADPPDGKTWKDVEPN